MTNEQRAELLVKKYGFDFNGNRARLPDGSAVEVMVRKTKD